MSVLVFHEAKKKILHMVICPNMDKPNPTPVMYCLSE